MTAVRLYRTVVICLLATIVAVQAFQLWQSAESWDRLNEMRERVHLTETYAAEISRSVQQLQRDLDGANACLLRIAHPQASFAFGTAC